MKQWLLGIATSITVPALLMILARILNNDKLKAMGLSHGRLISKLLRSKFGKKLGEKIEDFIENSSKTYFDAVDVGMSEDDNNGNALPPEPQEANIVNNGE